MILRLYQPQKMKCPVPPSSLQKGQMSRPLLRSPWRSSRSSPYLFLKVSVSKVSSKDLKILTAVVIMALHGYVPSCDGYVLWCERQGTTLRWAPCLLFYVLFYMIAQWCACGYIDKKKKAADPGLTRVEVLSGRARRVRSGRAPVGDRSRRKERDPSGDDLRSEKKGTSLGEGGTAAYPEKLIPARRNGFRRCREDFFCRWKKADICRVIKGP